MYRAARFVNFEGILGFCIPSIIWVGVGYPVNANCNGHFPFSQHFRNFQLGGNWNMFCRFVPLENSQKKWKKSKKVGPYSQLQFANRILCSIYTFLVVCTSSRSMVGHCDLPGFTTKWNNFYQAEIPALLPPKFPFFFLNWKCPTFEHVAELDLQIETKLKMAKRIAMVSGIFLKGRRHTLLYSFKWQ